MVYDITVTSQHSKEVITEKCRCKQNWRFFVPMLDLQNLQNVFNMNVACMFSLRKCKILKNQVFYLKMLFVQDQILKIQNVVC